MVGEEEGIIMIKAILQVKDQMEEEEEELELPFIGLMSFKPLP